MMIPSFFAALSLFHAPGVTAPQQNIEWPAKQYVADRLKRGLGGNSSQQASSQVRQINPDKAKCDATFKAAIMQKKIVHLTRALEQTCNHAESKYYWYYLAERQMARVNGADGYDDKEANMVSEARANYHRSRGESGLEDATAKSKAALQLYRKIIFSDDRVDEETKQHDAMMARAKSDICLLIKTDITSYRNKYPKAPLRAYARPDEREWCLQSGIKIY